MSYNTHGLSSTPIYICWVAMMSRCYKKQDIQYKYYGGRGIKVCKRWHSIVNFYTDMAPRPERKSIDRKNNDGNYTPRNCRWATKEQQYNNRSNSFIITYRRKKQTLTQWARKIRIKPETIRNRLVNLNWSIKEALNPNGRKYERRV